MATCICVIEKVLERIMNIRMAIMAAVISSTAVFTVHGVDVSVPGANPKMPAVVYSDNIVNQTTVDELRKDLRRITIVPPFMCYLEKIALFNLSCQLHLIRV